MPTVFRTTPTLRTICPWCSHSPDGVPPMATDLWPDFTTEKNTRGIKHVLEDAGQGLKEKTRGLVEFRVSPSVSTDPLYPFRFRCDLYVPKLSYSFLLVLVEA